MTVLLVIVGILVGACTLFTVVGAVSDRGDAGSPSPKSNTPTSVQATDRDPAAYETLSAREFALLVKDPDGFKGRKIRVYGAVRQFDSATGDSMFLASTGAEPKPTAFGYDQNTVIQAADPAIVKDIVEGDLVTLFVRVDGSIGYDTQIGGHTVVPKFTLNVIAMTNP